jgi:hypothetical protein
LGAPVMDMIMETIESVIAMHHGATIEEINDQLVISGLELGFLDILAKEYADLTPLLVQSLSSTTRRRPIIFIRIGSSNHEFLLNGAYAISSYPT